MNRAVAEPVPVSSCPPAGPDRSRIVPVIDPAEAAPFLLPLGSRFAVAVLFAARRRRRTVVGSALVPFVPRRRNSGFAAVVAPFGLRTAPDFVAVRFSVVRRNSVGFAAVAVGRLFVPRPLFVRRPDFVVAAVVG